MKLRVMLTLALLLTPFLVAQASNPGGHPDLLPGVRPDGSVLLPNQWSLRPVGRQVTVGDFPVQIVLHPGGRFAAVLHSGYGQHEIVVLDIGSAAIVSRVSVHESFYGIAFSPDGANLFCSGAGDEVLHWFSFADGYLGNHREIRVRAETERGVPSGLAVAPDGKTVWLANLWGNRVTRVEIEARRATEYPPFPARPGTAPPAAGAEANAFPYTCLIDSGRGRLFTSLWGEAKVAVQSLESGETLASWPTEEHPNEMVVSPDGAILYVANANRNTVTVFDVETGQVLETLSAALYPLSPPGSTPNSLALTPDGQILFVANACNNNVAVFDVKTKGKSRSLGFIPVGWYPTSVRVSTDGATLLVANGKGVISKPNRAGPQPRRTATSSPIREYIAGLFQGTVSVIKLPPREQLTAVMRGWTAQSYSCSPLLEDNRVTQARPANNPVPEKPGDPSPIKYCIYVVKENRTYDQVFGDIPNGNGDPTICLFPESISPNHHRLARQFVLLDNFYVESEVSADGHEWSMGAYASDFVEKTWPLSYGHNTSRKFPYPSEGAFPVAFPAAGYLWDRAREAGVDYRSYGEFVDNGPNPGDPAFTRIPALEGHFDPGFRGWDLSYPDVKRAERFISELKRFEKTGKMPQLQILRLPNDHTEGTSAGRLTPIAMMADNDLALGMVVEAVTQSKFWKETAIFVVEDDAQNGPDHVDAHRTVALVISPYSQHGTVDSSMYSTASMLRTMELILGLQPMSQFDAAARPMYNSFRSKANTGKYKAVMPAVNREERNSETAWGAKTSAEMDFSKEDAADDLLLNEVIWRSIRGVDNPMPRPRRAGFVLAEQEEGEE